MIESIENTIQLILTGACTGIAFSRALRLKERAWYLLGLFSGIYFLGDLYWTLFLFFYGKTPHYYSVAELSWYTAYLFLLLLIIYFRVEICGHRMPDVRQAGGIVRRMRLFHPLVWCVPAFTTGMCIFFMQWGDIISNILSFLLMTGILWHAVSGLLTPGFARGPDPGASAKRMFFLVTLAFCLIEYAMWIASCFWMGDGINNIYFWFDFLLSLTFLCFLPALRKAVVR